MSGIVSYVEAGKNTVEGGWGTRGDNTRDVVQGMTDARLTLSVLCHISTQIDRLLHFVDRDRVKTRERHEKFGEVFLKANEATHEFVDGFAGLPKNCEGRLIRNLRHLAVSQLQRGQEIELRLPAVLGVTEGTKLRADYAAWLTTQED